MISSLPLDGYTRTDPGRVRENNEDAAGGFAPADPAVLEERGALFVVADGMGGHAAGEVASNYAVNKILHAYYSLPWEGAEQTLSAAVQEANAEINAEGEQTPERRGMGSTVVAAAILDGRAVVANVGDSRAYLLHEGRLEPITRDHSWVAEHLADGMLTPEQAADHPNRNILTRNLGLRPLVEPDVRSWEFADGDRLLLCTDGLWGTVPEEQIAALLQQRTTAERATAALIAAANAAGGHDNIGVAVIGRGTAGRGNTRLFSNVPEPSFAAPITRQVRAPRTGLTRIAPYALAASAGVIFAAVIFAVAQAGGSGPLGAKKSAQTPTAALATASAIGRVDSPTVQPTPSTKATPTPDQLTPTAAPTQPVTPIVGSVLYEVRSGDTSYSLWQHCYQSTSQFSDSSQFYDWLARNNSGLKAEYLPTGQTISVPDNFTGNNCELADNTSKPTPTASSSAAITSSPTPVMRSPTVVGRSPTAIGVSNSQSPSPTATVRYLRATVSSVTGTVILHDTPGNSERSDSLPSNSEVCVDQTPTNQNSVTWLQVTGSYGGKPHSGWVRIGETKIDISTELC